MIIDYRCPSCGEIKTNQTMESFLCECGGFFRKLSEVPTITAFIPYYDGVLRSWVTSSHDQEKKMKNHKSYSHPHGLFAVQDDKKFLKECADVRRNRLDYLRKSYGDNYVKHQMETNPAFRDKVSRSTRTTFAFSR